MRRPVSLASTHRTSISESDRRGAANHRAGELVSGQSLVNIRLHPDGATPIGGRTCRA